MRERDLLIGAVVLVVVLAVAGTVAALATSNNLPWSTHTHVANIASDGTPTSAATPAQTATAPPGSTPGTPSGSATTGPPTAVAANVKFPLAFPNLPALKRMTNLLQVPGQQSMLVTLQDGEILQFADDPNVSTTTTVLDWRSKTSTDNNEEGLLGLAFDPAFATNGYIYIYYSAAGGDRRTVLSRLHATGSGASLKPDPSSELILLQIPQPFGNHKGGELVFGPDGMLYLGLGDGGSEGDPNGNGQDVTNNLLASIIRIDVRNASKDHPYAIPPDNPFASGSGGRPETWAYGLRNPWRFSFDSRTGELWAGDVGQNTYEEVDIVQAGKNYGWNIMEGFHCYKPSSGCDQSGLTLPVIEYQHSDGACSITGGYVYRGAAIPALDGAYVYADYCTGKVSAFPTAGAAPGSKPPVTTLRGSGTSVTSLAQDTSGELYLLEEDGKIYRMAAS